MTHKRFLSILLAVSMILTLIPATVFAEETVPDTETVHAHEYAVSEAVEPTCTEGGYTVYTCPCGDSFTQYSDPLGHSWDEGVLTLAPTAEAEGEIMYTCTVCSETYTEPVEKLPAADTEPEAPDETVGEPAEEPAEEPAVQQGTEGGAAVDEITYEARSWNDVIVTVKAASGVFPEDAVLSVEPVPAFEQGQADAAVEEARDADDNVAVRYSFDIKMINPVTGEEYQPAEGQKVKVFFSLAEASDRNLETDVYHVTEDEVTGELAAEKLDMIPEEQIPGEPALGAPETIVAVETDGFSYYTVEFTYGLLQYVLEGDSSVPIREILSAVGLTGEVTAVEVSNDSLFSASNETGEWMVTAHQAFDTDEWMKVTINDVEYEITVKDDSNETASNVKYWDHSWNGTAVEKEEKTRETVSVVPSNGAMTSGWYYLNSDVTVNSRICLTGDTYLILGDGYTMDVKGLYIPKGYTLRIYGQTGGTGYLYSHPSSGAGIGAYSGHKGGAVEIHGGIVKAEGYDHCAGIGGNDDDRKDIGSFTMYDGNVTAIGGDSGAGIGGGRACEGGSITIYGGTVKATGGHYGAGIGGGNGQDTDPMRGAHGGTIKIYGGTVTATGGDDGAGIGGGEGGNAGTIEISGGTVTAQGGNYSAGIGCGEGESTGKGGTVTISGGTVTATGGKNAAGIGGGEDGHCETITISGTREGTKVTATGGANGAGIGAGRDADGGTIRITGGTVIAEGKDSSAGIGGGDASDDFADYSNIEISGGDVKATGNSKGAGIGGGEYGHATVTITGGEITAKANGSGSAIGNGKDGSGSAIILGYTNATKDIKITAASYGGIVKLNQPFENDHYKFRATNALSASDVELLSDGELKAWLNADTPEETNEADSWTALQTAINGAAKELSVKLTESINANGAACITIPEGLIVEIDLNGKTMDRQLTANADGGSVIVVESGAALTIKDSSPEQTGLIKGGAASQGGGILNNGTLIMEGGTISSNTANTGGGVYNAGTMTITGGTISGNSSSTWGGGIYLPNGTNATLNLNGGTIENNTCGNNGGGIHVSETAFINISNNPVVTDNTKGTGSNASANNVNLAKGAIIVVTDTLDSDAQIGVSLSNHVYNITSGLKGNGTAANFISDDAGFTLATDGAGEVYLSKAAFRSVSTWQELQDAVNAASDGDLIELSSDVINTQNKTRIKVGDGDYKNKNIIIDLKGHELNRKRTSSDGDGHVIEVFEGSTLTIRDSVGGGTITGGYSKRGGGIYVHKDATCIITGGKITGNRATDDGGGIYVKGTLRMTGGIVQLNTAEDCGGGIFSEDTGEISLLNVTVTQNTADNDGGGLKLWLGADSSITSCRITYNVSDDHGGGLYMQAKGKTLTITDTVIDNNTSNDDGAGILLYNGTIVMNGGSLSYNTSDNDGGGAKITEKTTFTATGVAISGNTAYKEEGGGVKNYGTTSLTSCTITNNKAKRPGGGLYNDDYEGSEGVMILTDCTITGNSAVENGGGIYSDYKLTVIGGSITGNTSADSGGGIFIGDDSYNTVIGGDLIVKDNNAADQGDDIFLRTHKLEIKTQNPLTKGAWIGITKENDDGLGVFTSGYSQANPEDPEPSKYFFSPDGLEVKPGEEGEASLASGWKKLREDLENADPGAVFTLDKNYTAGPDDGPLEIPAGKTITIDLAGYTLNRNRTSKDGDGHVIWVRANGENSVGKLILKDTTATETAPGNGRITGGYAKLGGGIYVDENAVCEVTGVNIVNNKASDDGAGIYSKGEITVTNCLISNNIADDCGGGIFTENNEKAIITLENTVVTHNTAQGDDGGGMYLYLGQDSSITGCEISYNFGGDCGGGIFLDAEENVKLTIENTNVDHNTAVDDDGGGIYLMYGIIVMNGGSISNNTTDHDSGGIKVTKKTTFTATGVEIKNNKADGEEGGGIKNYGKTTLTNCTISGNSAAQDGGGIFNDRDGDGSAGELTIISCTITNNKAGGNGGGIYNDEKLTIKGVDDTNTEDVECTVISGNDSGGQGGGLSIRKDADYTKIEGKILILGNTANKGNDVYLRSGQVLELTGLIADTQIGVIDMDSVGVFTKNYSTNYPAKDANDNLIAANAPSHFFCTDTGAIPAEWNTDKTEAQLVSYWPELQTYIDKAAAGETVEGIVSGGIVKLDKDYTAGSDDVSLQIKNNYNVTIDLNGHIINRNLTSKKLIQNPEYSMGDPSVPPLLDVGHVIDINEGGRLTIKDSASEAADPPEGETKKVGVIMGGHGLNGGGINVQSGATLNFVSGTIVGNHAEDNGGGIYNAGTLSMDGGTVFGNGADDNGGGIYSSDTSSLYLENVLIQSNTTGDDGGGINIRLGDDNGATIKNCTITNNGATDYGGGLRFDAKGKTLTIIDTKIDKNYSGDDGAGIYLNSGTIEMTGKKIQGSGSSSQEEWTSSISGNVSYHDGGGVKVTDNTTFIANTVEIKNNKSNTEEGGGIKNQGKTTLTGCTVSGNTSTKQGGGIYNEEELTLENCTITNNASRDVGGGVYSDDELTIIGGEISGNKAANKGGGVYLGSDSCDTEIEGAVVIKDNEASNFGNDLYMRSDRKLKLTGALTKGADGPTIYVDLEDGTGVVAKKFKDYHKTASDEAENPEDYFAVAIGYDLTVNKDGAAEITSGWKGLKKKIEDAEDGAVIDIDQNYAAKDSDDRIVIDDDKSITIDLHGFTLNRRRKDEKDDGQVFKVSGGSTLTIKDSSTEKTGAIIGGWAKDGGGGIYVEKNAVLNLQGGTVSGNKADEIGGGIYAKGTLNMSGGAVKSNNAGEDGGGIYLSDTAVLNLSGGKVTDNYAAKEGGGIYVELNTRANVSGTPQVTDNRGAKAGNDVYLPKGCALTVTGALAEGAMVGVALEIIWGSFTNGYESKNAGKEPSLYFKSTEGYAVYLEDGEAVLGLRTYGKTDNADPFISVNNQINTDTGTISSQNWMSGISGERLLSEINTPGSHDSGMNNVDKNLNSTVQFITDIVTVTVEVVAALTLVVSVIAAPFTGGASLAAAGGLFFLASTACVVAVNVAIPTDWTSYLSWVADAISADKAKTQREYINQQLDEGARQLDIRLNNRKKVYKFVDFDDGFTFNGWEWSDNGTDLWICHGKKGGGSYLANDDNDDYLSFNQVLEWVEDFLTKHPTECIMLDLRPETEDASQHTIIYERARKILEQSALRTNPSTGEPFLYKEPGSDDYFAPYTQMPKLADCRGKIVVMPENNEFLAQVGGFRRKGLTSENLDELDYQNTETMMALQIEEEYSKANGDHSVLLPTDADNHYDRMWYWEMNCTGQKAGHPDYELNVAAPWELADYVNEETIGDGKVFNKDLAGQYIGWVRLDSFEAKYAETIWRTNYFAGLEYCEVKVQSGLNDETKYPEQTYKILKGTELSIPGNIYKNVDNGRYFDSWQADDGSTRKAGESFTVDDNVTFTAQWLEAGKIPVSIVWKDAEDADKLRAESIKLNVSITPKDSDTATTTSLTLNDEEDWSKIITALDTDTVKITPDWDLIVPTEGNPNGQDAEGQYCYDVELEKGTGYVVTLIHTPNVELDASGMVNWEDEDNEAQKRPKNVTVNLFKEGVETALAAKTVAAADSWKFDFGKYPQYENGEKITYSITETIPKDAANYYDISIDEFSVTNTFVPDKKYKVRATGLIYWDDAGDAKHLRPESVSVTMIAGEGDAATQAATQEVGETKGELWSWSFADLPKTDADGNSIIYSLKAESVDGYKMKCERIYSSEDGGGKKAETETGDVSYVYQITYTLNVEEDEKTPAAVTVAPDPIDRTYNGKEQVLIKKGEAEGGEMMYALGTNGTTAPDPTADPSAYSEKLPAGTDPGTYYVWYYVKGDVTHSDTVPMYVEAVISEPETVFISGVTGSFNDRIKLNYYFTFPDEVRADTGAYVTLTNEGTGKEVKLPIKDAEFVSGRGYKFSIPLVAKEGSDTISAKVFNGDGNPLEIKGNSGNDYTETGVQYTMMQYFKWLEEKGKDEKEKALGAAAKDYCAAAQIYFKYHADGLAVSSAVEAVTTETLSGYVAVRDGTLPNGVSIKGITAMLESDNTLRLYLDFENGTDGYTFAIDGKSVNINKRGDGAYYLALDTGVYSNHLQDEHTYTVSDGTNTYTITASVLTYARACAIKSNENESNLGKALYLYNKAAVAAFGG